MPDRGCRRSDLRAPVKDDAIGTMPGELYGERMVPSGSPVVQDNAVVCDQVHGTQHRVVLVLQYKDLVEGRGKHPLLAKDKKRNVVEHQKAQEKEIRAALKKQQADEKAKMLQEEEQYKRTVKEKRCLPVPFSQGQTTCTYPLKILGGISSPS
jgi:hypothetical protein